MVLTTPWGLADVNVTEIHVWSVLLHKESHFVTWKLWNNASKSSFLYTIMMRKSVKDLGFENACSRAKTYVILTSLNYVHSYARYFWWRQFLWQPRMRMCKVQKPCINSTWIAWLIHGFLPVKTWLLIAGDIAFYAIISNGPRQEAVFVLFIISMELYIVFTTQSAFFSVILGCFPGFNQYLKAERINYLAQGNSNKASPERLKLGTSAHDFKSSIFPLS